MTSWLIEITLVGLVLLSFIQWLQARYTVGPIPLLLVTHGPQKLSDIWREYVD